MLYFRMFCFVHLLNQAYSAHQKSGDNLSFPITFHYNTMFYQILELLCMFKHFNLYQCSIVMNNYFNLLYEGFFI